jgi:dimethylargininase
VIALTRDVPDSFANALAADPQPIDVVRARAQHDDYRAALCEVGADVIALPADDACPDCCFVEDTAVVAGERALICRPGAPSRQPEVEPVARALAAHREVHRMTAPATLDGGDVMRVGRTFYVGRSARTNDAGIQRLADVFSDHVVIPVDLPASVLHLKCVAATLGDGRVLLAEGSLPRSLFEHCVMIPEAETYAANVVVLGGVAIAAAGFTHTHDALSRAGFRVRPVDTTELRKADGSLTCLSVLLA